MASKTIKPLAGYAERTFVFGDLAQLARAPALLAGGRRFKSVILYKDFLPSTT